jgi:hypothetical protein
VDSGRGDGERAISQVLVVEFDELLRGVLHDLLTTVDHYAVTEVTTEAAALDYLATSTSPPPREAWSPCAARGTPITI